MGRVRVRIRVREVVLENGKGGLGPESPENVRGEQEGHADSAGDLADGSHQQADGGAGAGFGGIAPGAAAGEFEGERPDERAKDDTERAEEEADEPSNAGADKPKAGGAEGFGAVKADGEVGAEGEDGHDPEGDQDPGLGAGVPNDQAVAHGGGEDERCPRYGREHAAEHSDGHNQECCGEPEDLRQRHGLRIDVIRPGAKEGGTTPGAFGGYQAILIDLERRVLLGASESRKDGQAAGY